MKKRGFTLVELLVVMAIVGVLVGTLLPALSAARLQGKRLRAVANLRGMTAGFLNYAADNRGVVPRSVALLSGFTPVYWYHTILTVDLRPAIDGYGVAPLTAHPLVNWPAVNTPGNDSGNARAWPFMYWPGYSVPSLPAVAVVQGPTRIDRAVAKQVMFSEHAEYRADTALYTTLQPVSALAPNKWNGYLFELPSNQIHGYALGHYDGAAEMRKFGDIKAWVSYNGAWRVANFQP